MNTLRIGCRHIDQLLSDIETILNTGSSTGTFPQYHPDITLVHDQVYSLATRLQKISHRVLPRCVWIISKVEGGGDDQIFNRMLTYWIDDSNEQDILVVNHCLETAAALPQHTRGYRNTDNFIVMISLRCSHLKFDLSP